MDMAYFPQRACNVELHRPPDAECPAQQTLESTSWRWVTAAAAQPVALGSELAFLAAYRSLVPITRAGFSGSKVRCCRVAEHDHSRGLHHNDVHGEHVAGDEQPHQG